MASPINQQPAFGLPNQGQQNPPAVNRMEARRPAPLDLNGLRRNLEEDVFEPLEYGPETPAPKQAKAFHTPAK